MFLSKVISYHSPSLAFPATLHVIAFPLRQFSLLRPRAFAAASPSLQDIPIPPLHMASYQLSFSLSVTILLS